MKNFKIAVATAALALASGYAVAAGNTADSTINVSYDVVAALTITSPVNMVMPAVITSSSDTTVTLPPTGTATYLPANTNPNGTSGGNGGVGSAASVTVNGEPSFRFEVTDNLGMAPSPLVTPVLTNATYDDGNGVGTAFILDASGESTINIGATLNLPSGASTTATSALSFTVTVTYAGA